MMQNLQEFPLISVITVCRNAVQFIRQTVESVLNQTYPRLEYIVIDGGSTDGTAAIIAEYAPRLAYWHSRPDRGISHAFNLGLAQAHGDWILFLNSDDFFLADTVVADMVPHLVQHPEDDVIYGRVYFMTREPSPRPAPFVKIFGGPWSWRRFRFLDLIPHQAAFTNRRFFERVGTFDESLRCCQDYELFLRAGPHLRARFVPLDVSGMREGGVTSGELRVYRTVRQFQIATGALPRPLAWLNFFYRLGRHHFGRLLHRLLDRFAHRVSWPGRISREQLERQLGMPQ